MHQGLVTIFVDMALLLQRQVYEASMTTDANLKFVQQHR